MNRKEYLDKIAKYLARFAEEVKMFNSMGLYDYNIHAENALIPVLNKVFDINLTNANANGVRNVPSIDLGDEDNRIAFQVTTTTTLEKVKATLDGFRNYRLAEKFDILYVLMLSDKQSSYSQAALDNVKPNGFDFIASKHVVDLTDIATKIMDIQSLDKLMFLAKRLEQEFSDIQIAERQKRFIHKYLLNAPEKIFLNFLKITFSESLFIADISYDKEVCKASINDWRRSKKLTELKTVRKASLEREAFRLNEIYFKDYIIREDQIITFRNLYDSKERLRSIIDPGTITEISASDYYDTSEAHLSNFKHLLRQCLIQLGHGRGLQWVNDRQILRFKKDKEVPREVKKSWRKTNSSVKTVVFEMYNKKENHIICFRHMAFKPAFELIDGDWFLVVNPTWSFTNPYTSKASRYEASYLSGLLKQERNHTVYYQYRFWGYYFIFPDMLAPSYTYLRIEPTQPFDFTPSIDDAKWLPPKEFKPTNEREGELTTDNELSLKHFD